MRAILNRTFGKVKLWNNTLSEFFQGKFSIGIQIKSSDDSDNMLVASGHSHLEVQEAFKVFMVNVFITPIIDLFEEFFDIIIVTCCHLLLNDLLLTGKLQLLMNQFR